MMNSILLALLITAFAAPVWAAPAARAVLEDSKGNQVGTVEFEAAGKKGVKLQVRLHGLPPGRHGFHIHEKGECEAPDFKSAGGHFNPRKKEHGLKSPKGAHAGDMPNIVVSERGRVRTTLYNDRISLEEDATTSVFRGDGTAVVVHAGADDQKSDPAGDAGARIACGVIKKK